MKRTLTVVFSLMMIMIALVACKMEEDSQHKTDATTGGGFKKGDVSIRISYNLISLQAQEDETVPASRTIERGHFKIGIAREDGSIFLSTTTPIADLGVKVQMRHEDATDWTDVEFGTTKYGDNKPEGSGNDIIFRVVNTSDETKFDTTHVKIKVATEAS